jgi:chemotaxis protein MotB
MADEANARSSSSRRSRSGRGGHHGGAWKVAYADFVTAMMAFFMVMWLVGIGAPKEQRAACSTISRTPAWSRAERQGRARPGRGGASTSRSSPGRRHGHAPPTRTRRDQSGCRRHPRNITEDEAQGGARGREAAAESLMDELKEAIDKSVATGPVQGPAAARHHARGPAHPDRGRPEPADVRQRQSVLKDYMRRDPARHVAVLPTCPTASLSKATPTPSPSWREAGYSNWELSADRANASRRELLAGGLERRRCCASRAWPRQVLFDAQNPESRSTGASASS